MKSNLIVITVGPGVITTTVCNYLNCIAFSGLPLSPATEHEVNWTFISAMKVLGWW